jgi:hypothetical protein
MCGRDAGYRVVSYVGLGAGMMAVRLAYQKEWLGWRGMAVAVVDEMQREGGASCEGCGGKD